MIGKLFGFFGRCLIVVSSLYLGYSMLSDPAVFTSTLNFVTSKLALKPLVLSQAKVVITIAAHCIIMSSILTVLKVRTAATTLIAVELLLLASAAETVPAILRLCTIGALLLV
jgi:hypothetical protein